MQLFIDTAKVDEIRTAAGWGILDGVTTNPTHIAATGRLFEDVLREIFSIVDGPISVETVSLDAEAIVAEGRAIAQFHRNAVVKVPVMIEGLKAVKQLSSEGIRTNVTLCFSATQAFLAAKAGATAVIQPGGSIKDVDVIAAADRLGIGAGRGPVHHFHRWW